MGEGWGEGDNITQKVTPPLYPLPQGEGICDRLVFFYIGIWVSFNDVGFRLILINKEKSYSELHFIMAVKWGLGQAPLRGRAPQTPERIFYFLWGFKGASPFE